MATANYAFTLSIFICTYTLFHPLKRTPGQQFCYLRFPSITKHQKSKHLITKYIVIFTFMDVRYYSAYPRKETCPPLQTNNADILRSKDFACLPKSSLNTHRNPGEGGVSLEWGCAHFLRISTTCSQENISISIPCFRIFRL